MRKIPAQPKIPVEATMDRLLKENDSLKPKMLLLYEQDAAMKHEKHMAFVKAGFTDDQAFELLKLSLG